MQRAPTPRENAAAFVATAELRAALERAAMAVTLAPGDSLFLQGDDADALYLLDQGEIAISVLAPSGRKLGLEIITEGEIFGEIGLFTGRRTASATALGVVRLRQVRRPDLLALIRPEPDLALELIELLCARLRVMSERHEDRAFLPLSTRLARLLLRLQLKIGKADGSLPVSQAELADFTGATREGVAKTLAIWRGQGWIRPGRGTLRILDRAALEAVAASPDD
ncbi:MAG: Crp/Fnr family transcriptional regulator [Geminicoccaceae bacterium]|jgi:CRP-like cAMP-binding protein|nr:Crp/Fnr family transcriptional regulator [Geminicoccaceae bacterium]MCB9967571.1 Crp/Fnr family transcriptional regulator [Geminicoccaceae bacterium]HRY24888.1 Crp/Fnr family transcriptional regulator [Geminicoccaceae bacterium]